MKRNITIMIGAVIGILCLSTALKGQSKDEEINLSISKEENGELRTFEKTYRSMEEMKNDKEYQEFLGEGGSVWINIDEELDKEIKVKIKADQEGDFTFSTDDDEDIQVVNLSSLTEGVSNIELEIKKVMEKIDEESLESVQKIIRTIHLTDEDYIDKNRSSMNISISDVSKGDFNKKSLTNPAEKLDVEKLRVKVNGDRLIVLYPISKPVETKVSLYDEKDDVLFIARIAETSEDLQQQIDLSQQPAGDYWLELMVGDKRTTKKINIKREE